MCADEIGHYPGREKLKYPEHAKQQFSFLLEIGFRLIHEEISLLHYSNGSQVITLFHAPWSHELGLEFSCDPDFDKRIDISVLLQYFGYPNASDYRNFAAVDEEGVKVGLERLSNLLRFCLDARLLDPVIMKKLGSFFLEERQQNARARAIKFTQLDAEPYWRAKNFEEYVRVLGPIERILTKSDKAKLKYARKKLQEKGLASRVRKGFAAFTSIIRKLR